MPPFNATDAIFFGFRIIRRDPLLMLAIAALIAIVGYASTLATWRLEADFAVEMREYAEAGDAAETPEAMSALATAWARYATAPPVLLSLLASVIAWLAAQGAVLRGLVLDRRGGWVLGLGLGGDEGRIFVVSLVTGLILIGFNVAALLAVGIIGGLAAAGSEAVGGLIMVLGLCATVFGMLVVATRFSAAAPASVGERRFVVLGSWRLTQGRMWSLLGAYVILIFLLLVAALVVQVLSALLAPGAAALLSGVTTVDVVVDPTSIFLSPGYMFLVLLNGGLEAGVMAAFAGVGAYAYRWLGAAAGYPNAAPPTDASPAAA